MNNTEDKAYRAENRLYYPIEDAVDLFFIVKDNDQVFFKMKGNVFMFKYKQSTFIFEYWSNEITLANIEQMYKMACDRLLM